MNKSKITITIEHEGPLTTKKIAEALRNAVKEYDKKVVLETMPNDRDRVES